MRRLVSRLSLSLPAILLIVACSSGQPDQAPRPQAAATSASATAASASAKPANPVLGSSEWYAWVDQGLGISDDDERGPAPGSLLWNEAVQRRLGQQAPPSQPGSPDWQQAVDTLLRTRAASSH